MRVAVLGSGFAGTVLARILRRQGHRTHLLERFSHPRFAVGESSTPLAAFCLERLARRYDLEDLSWLAAYGRWTDRIPGVRRGLKRGFTFYRHRPGEPYRNDARNSARFLVAASPTDRVADSHWLRSDVDHFLVQRALAEGVEYRERVRIDHVEKRGSGWRLSGGTPGGRTELDADLVVDATGAGQLMPRQLGLGSVRPPGTPEGPRTGALFGHLADVPSFRDVAGAAATGAGAAAGEFPAAPFPEERAAVHHMLEEGWLWVLPFDHGTVSVGVVYDLEHPAAGALRSEPPEDAWSTLLARYPTLARQFEGARTVHRLRRVPRLQRRLQRAAGRDWALLPHTFAFVGPLFSTGIAWSLLAVERLGLLLEMAQAGADGALPDGLRRYDLGLRTEADHLSALLGGAHRVRRSFDEFVAYSHVYFAAASYAEAAQRILPCRWDAGPWAWEGFLGAADPVLRRAVREAAARLDGGPDRDPVARGRTATLATVRELVAPRNVAGLADPRRNRMYPLDLECVVENAGRLGLSREEVRSSLHRLRG